MKLNNIILLVALTLCACDTTTTTTKNNDGSTTVTVDKHVDPATAAAITTGVSSGVQIYVQSQKDKAAQQTPTPATITVKPMQ